MTLRLSPYVLLVLTSIALWGVIIWFVRSFPEFAAAIGLPALLCGVVALAMLWVRERT